MRFMLQSVLPDLIVQEVWNRRLEPGEEFTADFLNLDTDLEHPATGQFLFFYVRYIMLTHLCESTEGAKLMLSRLFSENSGLATALNKEELVRKTLQFVEEATSAGSGNAQSLRTVTDICYQFQGWESYLAKELVRSWRLPVKFPNHS